MLEDLAWVVLHGGHPGDAAVSFEAVLGSLVVALAVVGALWYLGVFEPADGSGDEGAAD